MSSRSFELSFCVFCSCCHWKSHLSPWWQNIFGQCPTPSADCLTDILCPLGSLFQFCQSKDSCHEFYFGYCIFDTPSENCSSVRFFMRPWKVNNLIFLVDVLQMYELLLLFLVHPHPYSLEDNIGLHGKRWNQHSSKACSQTSEWKVRKYRRQQLLYQVRWLHAFLFFQFGHQTTEFDQTIAVTVKSYFVEYWTAFAKVKRVKKD